MHTLNNPAQVLTNVKTRKHILGKQVVIITYQYCRFCGFSFDIHHIGDPLVWVAQVVCKLCNCRWKNRLKTFFDDERERESMAGLYGAR